MDPSSAPERTDGGPVVRIRLDLAYDGGPFAGWARQPGRSTVQGSLEEAMELVLREPVRLTVAGRTDAGVHARGQVAHADLTAAAVQRLRGRDGSLDPWETLRRRLGSVLGRILGSARRETGRPEAQGAIVVVGAGPAPEGFDARFSATARRYVYRIDDGRAGHDPLTRGSTWWVDQPLDLDAMRRAVAPLPGLHDFLSYCRPREGATTIRELQVLSLDRDPRGLVEVRVQADAFCHSMVRSLVGAAVDVGRGRRDPAWMRERLAARERSGQVVLAPPHGLVLERVLYPADGQLALRAEQTRAVRPAVDAQDGADRRRADPGLGPGASLR